MNLLQNVITRMSKPPGEDPTIDLGPPHRAQDFQHIYDWEGFDGPSISHPESHNPVYLTYIAYDEVTRTVQIDAEELPGSVWSASWRVEAMLSEDGESWQPVGVSADWTPFREVLESVRQHVPEHVGRNLLSSPQSPPDLEEPFLREARIVRKRVERVKAYDGYLDITKTVLVDMVNRHTTE